MSEDLWLFSHSGWTDFNIFKQSYDQRCRLGPNESDSWFIIAGNMEDSPSSHRCNIAVIIWWQKGTINNHCDINCQAAPPPVRYSGRWQLPPIGAATAEIRTNQIAGLSVPIALQKSIKSFLRPHPVLHKDEFWSPREYIQVSKNKNVWKDQDQPIGLKIEVAAAMTTIHWILACPLTPLCHFGDD